MFDKIKDIITIKECVYNEVETHNIDMSNKLPIIGSGINEINMSLIKNIYYLSNNLNENKIEIEVYNKLNELAERFNNIKNIDIISFIKNNNLNINLNQDTKVKIIMNILSNIHSISNKIAMESRLGPGNTIICNSYTYSLFNLKQYISSNYKIILSENIKNFKYIICRIDSNDLNNKLVLFYNKQKYTIVESGNNVETLYGCLNIINYKTLNKVRKDKLKNILN